MTSRAQRNVRRPAFEHRLRMTMIAVALTLPAIATQAQTQAPASAQGPQVYKWVDANGRVQYSERKPTDAATRSTEIKLPPQPQPASAPAPAPAPVSRPQPDASRQPVAPPARRHDGAAVAPARSLSAGLNRDTDAYRCALAKDVLSGAVQHANGEPTDNHDRQVAQNDIRLFCK